MSEGKKKFVKNISKALKQIKEGKGLTKEQVFGKTKEKELREKLNVMLPRNKAGNDMLRAIISMAKQKGKVELEEQLKIDFVKDLMKLPMSKKKRTIEFKDVNKLVMKITKELVDKNPNIMETLEIMSDKKVMKRFKKPKIQHKKQ